MVAQDPRRLRLAYIDDKPAALPAPEIEVMKFRGLRAVERWIVDPARLSADIVLCDVNMAHRHKDHPPEVAWGPEGALPAYGPILALPFLSTDNICEFVPISSWWARVENDGYVLIPVALLLTTIARRPVSLGAAREWVAKQASASRWRNTGGEPVSSTTASAAGTTDPVAAISAGLVGLRAKLSEACEHGRLTIAGLDSTIECLRLWRDGLPLESDGGPARVEILYPDRSDFIRVTSLFADTMHFREIPSSEEIAAIVRELEAWRGRDICFQFPRSGGVYEQAAKLLTDRLPRKADCKKGAKFGSNHLKERAAAAGKATGLDPLLLTRIAMIFAFLRAWYFAHVLEGEYDDDEGAYGLIDWAYWFLDIHPRRRPQNPLKRLLGTDDEDGKIVIGTSFHQRPFDPSAKRVFDAYAALRKNDRLSLTPFEKALGRRFIEDGERFFPSAIKPEHRKLWQPHLEDEMMALPAWLK